ncbi:MAG TPA: (2Fe-2S) ferredoxin domain-containing protein [Rubrobacter sp.]|nr:(2Fe-2S) ferredoxin domain-containing protein [Rubrobacter sp.]
MPASEPEEDISKRGKKAKKQAQKGGALATLAKSAAKVRDYDSHVLVCKGGDCKKRGANAVRKALKDELRAEGMNRDVRVDSVDCLGLCKHGPNLIVYPGGTWYLGVVEQDVPEIVQGHLKNDEPVEHLAAELRPRRRAR